MSVLGTTIGPSGCHPGIPRTRRRTSRRNAKDPTKDLPRTGRRTYPGPAQDLPKDRPKDLPKDRPKDLGTDAPKDRPKDLRKDVAVKEIRLEPAKPTAATYEAPMFTKQDDPNAAWHRASPPCAVQWLPVGDGGDA